MGIACLRNRNNERTCLGMCGIAGEGESVKQSKMAVYAWDLRHTCLYQKALETLFVNITRKKQKTKETLCQQGFCLAIFGITYLFFYLKTSSNFSVVLRFVKPVNSNKVRFLFPPSRVVDRVSSVSRALYFQDALLAVNPCKNFFTDQPFLKQSLQHFKGSVLPGYLVGG